MSVEGVDYAFPPRPDIAALAAAGKMFACRYGGPGSASKQLSPVEAKALIAAGIAIVANAEGSADGLLGGWSAGVSWARAAQAHFLLCGMPPDRPVYLSVDFDVSSSQWPRVRESLRGAASVLGAARVGVYGGRRAIEWARRDGVAQWFWQTYAWSGGHWVPGNHIEQYRNGVRLAGAQLDLNRAHPTDFGQWGTTIGDDDMGAERTAYNADRYLWRGLMSLDPVVEGIRIDDNDPSEVGSVPNRFATTLAALVADVAELKSRPPVAVDPDMLKGALLAVARELLGSPAETDI